MLTPATKYADVRAMAKAVNSPSHVATTSRRRRMPPARMPSSSGSQSGGVSGRAPAPSRAPAVIIRPKAGAAVNWEEYFWRELREGGVLHEYLRREKAQNQRRVRQVARAMNGWKQNNKSDWRLLAALPGRVAHRLAKENPDFWRDDDALRSLRRGEPDLPIHV